MRVMALDAEFNQPSGKCIEVGAVVFDAKTGLFIANYQSYVNPGEPIYNIDPTSPEQPTNIVKLTGITDAMVHGAPTMAQVYEELRWFHAKYKVFTNPIVWGSGVRNDSLALYEQSKSSEPNFMGYRVIDAKGLFQSIQLKRDQKVRGGLEATCKKLGIGFEGRPHGALADAHNTFRVWFHLLKEFK